jgi:hypothetical protein
MRTQQCSNDKDESDDYAYSDHKVNRQQRRYRCRYRSSEDVIDGSQHGRKTSFHNRLSINEANALFMNLEQMFDRRFLPQGLTASMRE